MLDLKFDRDDGAELDERVASSLRRSLELLIADMAVAAAKAQTYHWNVGAAPFGPAERLFREIVADHIDGQDDAAERLRALGGHVEGRPSALCGLSRLAECDGRIGEEAMTAALRADQAVIAEAWRGLAAQAATERDEATADLARERGRRHERFAHRLAGLRPAAPAEAPRAVAS